MKARTVIRKLMALLSCYGMLAIPVSGATTLTPPDFSLGYSFGSGNYLYSRYMPSPFLNFGLNTADVPNNYVELPHSPASDGSAGDSPDRYTFNSSYSTLQNDVRTLSGNGSMTLDSVNLPMTLWNSYRTVTDFLSFGTSVDDEETSRIIQREEHMYGDFERSECNAYDVAPSISSSIKDLADHFDDNLCGSDGMSIQMAFSDVLKTGDTSPLLDRTNFCDMTMDKAKSGVCQGSKASTDELRNFMNHMRENKRKQKLSNDRKESILRNLIGRYMSVSKVQSKLASNPFFMLRKKRGNFDESMRCTPGKLRKVIMDSHTCGGSGNGKLVELFNSQFEKCNQDPSKCGIPAGDLVNKPEDMSTLDYLQLSEVSSNFHSQEDILRDDIRNGDSIDSLFRREFNKSTMLMTMIDSSMNRDNGAMLSLTPEEEATVAQARAAGNYAQVREIFYGKAINAIKSHAGQNHTEEERIVLEQAIPQLQEMLVGGVVSTSSNYHQIASAGARGTVARNVASGLSTNDGGVFSPTAVVETVNNAAEYMIGTNIWLDHYLNGKNQMVAIQSYQTDKKSETPEVATSSLNNIVSMLDENGFYNSIGNADAMSDLQKKTILNSMVDHILNAEGVREKIISDARQRGVDPEVIESEIITLTLQDVMYDNSKHQCDVIEEEAQNLCQQEIDGDYFNGILALDEINDLGNEFNSSDYFGSQIDSNDATFKRALISCYSYMISPSVKHSEEDCSNWKSAVFGYPITEEEEKSLFGMSCKDTVTPQGTNSSQDTMIANITSNTNLTETVNNIDTANTSGTSMNYGGGTIDSPDKIAKDYFSMLKESNGAGIVGGKITSASKNGGVSAFESLNESSGTSGALEGNKEDSMFSNIFGFGNDKESQGSENSGFFSNLFNSGSSSDSEESDESELQSETETERVARERKEQIERERIAKLNNSELLAQMERMKQEQSALRSQLDQFFNQGKDKSNMSTQDQQRIQDLERRLADAESREKRLAQEAQERNLVDEFMAGTSRNGPNTVGTPTSNGTTTSSFGDDSSSAARNVASGVSNASSSSINGSVNGGSTANGTNGVGPLSVNGSGGEQGAIADIGPLLTSSEVVSLSVNDLANERIFDSLAAAEVVLQQGGEAAYYKENGQVYVIQKIQKEGPLRDGEAEFVLVKKLVKVGSGEATRNIASELQATPNPDPVGPRNRKVMRVEDLIDTLDGASEF
ncbi:MAG: hypothetical protein GY909_07970 [Oligoflexia bacterium]|nr:hypothetical protein [Oligoflexia bacterium]